MIVDIDIRTIQINGDHLFVEVMQHFFLLFYTLDRMNRPVDPKFQTVLQCQT